MKYVIAETFGRDYYWIVEAKDEREAIGVCSFDMKDAVLEGCEAWIDGQGECHSEADPEGRDIMAMIKAAKEAG
jgi:hypothetical protein